MPSTAIQGSRAPTRRATIVRVAMLCVALTPGHGLSAVAQRGPVLPTWQDFKFPPPSNVNKPVVPQDSLGPASDEFERSDSGSEAFDYQPPVPPRAPAESEVFEPPTLIAPRKLDFGTPDRAPSLPLNRRTGRTTPHNLGVAVTEALLNELASDVRQEADAVCERILGTPVSGTQTTNATTRIDCRNNPQTAQCNVVLESLTSSTTLGRRPNAMISTEGFHRADLVKPVFFDGQTLTTRRPQGFVKANNLNRGIVTTFTGVPLIGPVANRFALTQAEQSRVAGETETAQSLTRRVVPQFNRSVDDRLSAANTYMKSDLRTWLQTNNLWPEDLQTSTTDNEMRVRARYGNITEVSVPGRRLFGRFGSVLLHETAVNSYLEGLNLRGLRISDRQLKRTLSGLVANEVPAAEVRGEAPIVEDLSKPLLYTLVFADTDPVSVRFDEDESEVVLRLGIEPVVGQLIPVQEIHLPLLARVDGGSIVLEFGTPGVVPGDGSEPGVASQLIGQQIATMTKSVTVPNQREFSLDGTRTIAAKVSDIAAANGWLLIAID